MIVVAGVISAQVTDSTNSTATTAPAPSASTAAVAPAPASTSVSGPPAAVDWEAFHALDLRVGKIVG